MRNIKYMLAGVIFGVALTKGEAISWYRIQEMFRFESFHMFGIFMTAVPTGALTLLLIRQREMKTMHGERIEIPVKLYHHGVIIGGLVFGCGWTLTGACPGPLYAQIGSGSLVTIATLLSAIVGTWVFERIKDYLPD